MTTQMLDLIIGNNIENGNHFFKGKIDDISLWSDSLSIQDINHYMNCPPSGNETNLVGYWNFEQGIGTVANDVTANGNNGTINGATYDTDTPKQNCVSCTATDNVYEPSKRRNSTPKSKCVFWG